MAHPFDDRPEVALILGPVTHEQDLHPVVRQLSDLSRRRRHSRPGAGSPPYGYRIADGSLVPDPAEHAALVRIAELRASGATLREIARELDSNGHKPKRGERWHPESVRRIVERLEPK